MRGYTHLVVNLGIFLERNVAAQLFHRRIHAARVCESATHCYTAGIYANFRILIYLSATNSMFFKSMPVSISLTTHNRMQDSNSVSPIILTASSVHDPRLPMKGASLQRTVYSTLGDIARPFLSDRQSATDYRLRSAYTLLGRVLVSHSSPAHRLQLLKSVAGTLLPGNTKQHTS